MRILLFLVLITAQCGAVAAGNPVGNPATEQLEQEAQALAEQFVGQLKPQLKKAMKQGGPGHAIEICASVAPRLADSLSVESGWLVRRVSLKSRNASRAVPDQWERSVLESFDQRQAAGEQASTLHRGEVQGNQYRYMQAQGVESICLVCHGENLEKSVLDTLQQYYPDDWATGYTLGQVRGAVSLTKNLSTGKQAE